MNTINEPNRNISFIFLWQQNDWGLFKRRNESLLWELSGRDAVESVLHIEPVTIKGFLGLILKWWRAKDAHIRQVYRLHLKKFFALHPLSVTNKKNVYVYSIFILYSGTVPFLKRVSNFLIKLQVNSINKAFVGSKDRVVIIAYLPSHYLPEAIKTIKHNVLVADLVDDVIARTEDVALKNTFIENYKSILPRCKWIFSTSPIFNRLYKNYAKQEIEFLPNGVDCSEYAKSSSRKLIKKDTPKVAGYVGNLFGVIDFDLFKYVVSCCPQIDFVLIGPTDKERLKHINEITSQYTNCHYLGARKFTEVPDYIASFDILISFKKVDYKTRGNDSMKIYQYLATGKPIVTTPVSPADRFDNVMYVASDKFEFVKYLKLASEENDPEMRRKRINMALENTWSKRADIILNRVSKFFGDQI